MNKKVKIMADSTCDLSPDLINRYDITIIPLHVLLNEDEFEDGVDITPAELISWSDENKTTPKTSAPGHDTIVSKLLPYKESGEQVMVFTISEDMSTTANVVRLIADELDMSEQVFVFDSRSLSTGIALLVVEAAVRAEAGMPAEAIISELLPLVPKVRASFVIDTLVYLHRGGRCSSVAALLGNVLKLHPQIDVINGKMIAGHKYRGGMKSVTMEYAKSLEEALKNARPERVFITHSPCETETVNAVREYLEGLNIFTEIHETNAGAVVSSHCGPGTLGVLFISK